MSISYPTLKDFEQLLLINDEEEMNIEISDNYPKITKFFNNILQRLKKGIIPEKEINSFIYALKFIDNLNLFIDDKTLDKFSNLMKEIYSKVKNNKKIDYESKDHIIQRIEYTELTFITHRKKFYKDIFFNNPNKITKEINEELKKVNKNGKFNNELFQQIQNLYWILKNRIEDVEDKKSLEKTIKDLKKINYDNNYYYDNYYNNNFYDNDYYDNNYYYYKNKYYDNNYNNNFYNKYSYGYKRNRNDYENINYYGGYSKGILFHKNKTYFNHNYNTKNINKNNIAVEITSKINNNEEAKKEINEENNDNNNKIIMQNENKTLNRKDDDKNIKNVIIKQETQIDKDKYLEIQDFNEIKNINKININNLENHEGKNFEEDINEKNYIKLNKHYYNIMNNIHDFYSNYNIFNSYRNNIINKDIENNDFDFIRKYSSLDDKEIIGFYKKFLFDYKEVKLKEKKNVQKSLENKNKLFKNDNNIEKALLKLNISQILKQALEEVEEEESKINLNIIKENEEKENSLISDNFSFDNILKIFQDEKKIKYEKYRKKKKDKIKKNKSDSEENLKNEENTNLLKEYIFYTHKNLNSNSQMICKELSDLINNYKQNKLNINISLINYIISNNNFFDLQNEDLAEYLYYKILILQNPNYISINLQIFENYFLFPLYHNIIANSSKKVKTLNYIFKKYSKIINSACENNDIIEEISPYGSLINNFLDEEGDIDICVVPKIPWYKFNGHVHKIINKIKNKNIGKIKFFNRSKSFFLISVYDEETKTDLDITIHNFLPILNSKLIKLYSQYDQRFHIMGIYLKHWSKLNNIHGAAIGYLSSYSLLLILINFLQNIVKPSVLPDLQNNPINDDFENPKYGEKDYKYYHGRKKVYSNIYFEENFEKIDKYMNFINKGEKNKESVGNLLLKFFEYYAYYYDNKNIISINNKSIDSISNNKHKNNGFTIEDPFESKHKPGNSLKLYSSEYCKFINCMKKEINFILSGEYIERFAKIMKQ